MRIRLTGFLRVSVVASPLMGFLAIDFQSVAVAQTVAKATAVQPPTMADVKPRDYPGLLNVVAYHSDFYSGGVPDGYTGFETLAGMGVRTIISVDGAEPEIERAHARGIRYIHLPIGYNGFDDERKLELVRATRDAMNDGPVYMHCHHGKHRSAGAAAAIAVSLGWATPQTMVDRMKVSGTSPSYKGLYACAGNATALDPAVINAVTADFPEVSHPNGFVKTMVELDEVFEHLRAIERAGWMPPVDHPDLVPVAEAGRLADLFRIVADADRAQTKPADFEEALRDSAAQAQVLEDLLAVGGDDAKMRSGQFQLIGASCKSCHEKYRD